MLFARRFSFLGCLWVAGLLLLGACNSGGPDCGIGSNCSSGDPVRTCALQAGPDSRNFPLTVQYSADLSGDAQIIELTYQNNNGTQSRDSLTSTWSKEVSLDRGISVEITADVEMTDGSAKVAYVARDSTGEVSIQATDQCGTG